MYALHFEQIEQYWPALLHGFEKTIAISCWSSALCFVIVLLAYAIRFSFGAVLRRSTVALIRVYIDVMQAVPVLVGLVWVYFGLPLLGFEISPDNTTVLILGISFSAFALDLFMGAEKAITREQIHVGLVHGVSPGAIGARIYLPTIIRTTIDPLVGQVITVLKLSTFASVIGSQEILSVANGIIAKTYRPLETYSLVALVFVVAIVPVNLVRRLATHRAAQRGEIG